MNNSLHFGVKTMPQMMMYEDIVRVWRATDANEVFTHAWVFDHFYPIAGADPSGPCLEGWTLLAALAAQTERVRVGVLVTGNPYRHPAVLAKMAATVDHIAHGRLDFGIGAAWSEQEHTSYGIPFFPPGERIRRMGEACEIIRRLWTEEVVTFDGAYYRLAEARCAPKPLQHPCPPFVIGGNGEKLMLRMVARYADIWNTSHTPTSGVAEFRHRSAVLDDHCAAVGRDPATIERSVQLLINPLDLAAGRETLRQYIEAGATHLVLCLLAPFPDGIVERMAAEIAVPLSKEYA
ncbi:MAG: LLM class F420-dependent oxidoreductase [Ktedonobacteraceae bacterium]|nr:LLM class F420-dependent oxidoreductase [Ktedonobacteraceae bacterium]MBO0790581.1 LLM class F420-dependent oxidoreductase [Ktedonobacteraceae bacterium]